MDACWERCWSRADAGGCQSHLVGGSVLADVNADGSDQGQAVRACSRRRAPHSAHSVHGLCAACPCIELRAGPIDIFPSPIRDPSKASSGRVPHPFSPGRKRWGLGSYRPSGVDSSRPESISNAQCRSDRIPEPGGLKRIKTAWKWWRTAARETVDMRAMRRFAARQATDVRLAQPSPLSQVVQVSVAQHERVVIDLGGGRAR